MALEEMDLAAGEAEQELSQLPQEAVIVIADWWRKYYMRAGHKRLGRILVSKSAHAQGSDISELKNMLKDVKLDGH